MEILLTFHFINLFLSHFSIKDAHNDRSIKRQIKLEINIRH